MKWLAGWAVSATLLLAATAVQAQVGPYGSPYARVSDFDGPYEPYGAMPPAPPRRGDGVSFLPPHEVFEVLREAGFSPLGAPHLRGFVYVMTAIDRRGDDGRLVMDARTGDILNFTPAYRMGDNGDEDMNYRGPPNGPYGPYDPYGRRDPYGPRSAAPLPQMPAMANGPRPPAPIPHVASRAMPQPAPRTAALPPAVRPQPLPQQSATAEPRRPAAPAAAMAQAPAPPPTVGQVTPAPQMLPTQPMPKAQDLEY